MFLQRKLSFRNKKKLKMMRVQLEKKISGFKTSFVDDEDNDLKYFIRKINNPSDNSFSSEIENRTDIQFME